LKSTQKQEEYGKLCLKKKNKINVEKNFN